MSPLFKARDKASYNSALPWDNTIEVFFQKAGYKDMQMKEGISGATSLWDYGRDTWRSQVDVKAPDVIRFTLPSACKTIEEMMKLGNLTLIKAWKDGSYFYETPAKESVQFFKTIVALQQEDPKVCIPVNLFQNTLKTLFEHKHIKKDDMSNLKAAVRTKEALQVFYETPGNSGDSEINRAVAVAFKYAKGSDKHDYFEPSEVSLQWLCQAKKWASKLPEIPLCRFVNFNEFFAHFSIITTTRIFESGYEEIAEAASQAKTITQLNMRYKQNFDKVISENIGRFIEKSKSLEVLNLISCRHADSPCYLTDEIIAPIAKALAVSESVEKVGIDSEKVGDEGILLVLDALKTNKKSKVNTLFLACPMTDQSARQLVQLIKSQPRIFKVTFFKTEISKAIQEQIANILKNRQPIEQTNQAENKNDI